MIAQRIFLILASIFLVSHRYVSSHGAPNNTEQEYHTRPEPSAPPFEEQKKQSVKETYVYVKEKVTVVEKKDEVDLALVTETFARIWLLFYTIDESGRAAFGAILGTLAFSGVSVLCGNNVVSPTTAFAALGGTLAGGTAGLGYTLLYGHKKPKPHVTVTVKTEYSSY